MADLVVITFDRETDALGALHAMRALEQAGALRLTDSAIVAKDLDGEVHVQNEWSSGVEIGAISGGIFGLLTAFLFPVVGVVVGAALGGWIGSKLDTGVDRAFVNAVSESLTPGRSALFLMIATETPDALSAALHPFAGRGHVLQTSIRPEVEEMLRQALPEPR